MAFSCVLPESMLLYQSELDVLRWTKARRATVEFKGRK